MSDEKFEEFLQRESQAYNTPPAEVPREAMWEAIAAARDARRAQPAPRTDIAPLPARRPWIRVYAPLIGMAATLLVGIGIGRFVSQSQTSEPRVAAVPTDSPATGMATGTNGAETGAEGSVAGQDAVAAQRPTDAANPKDAATPKDAAAPPRQLAPRRDLAPQRFVAAVPSTLTPSTPSDTRPANDAMSYASREHLGRAEALITVVAASSADATTDSLTARWAREMLSNTRLLLDSPAGDDPIRRRLLEDLEMLLVQLVQRSGDAVGERELIDRTLERTQLLTRLRTGAAGI